MWIRFSFEAQGENETAMGHKAVNDERERESSILAALICEIPALAAMARDLWHGPQPPEEAPRVDAKFDPEAGTHPAVKWYEEIPRGSPRAEITFEGGLRSVFYVVNHGHSVILASYDGGVIQAVTLESLWDEHGRIVRIKAVA